MASLLLAVGCSQAVPAQEPESTAPATPQVVAPVPATPAPAPATPAGAASAEPSGTIEPAQAQAQPAPADDDAASRNPGEGSQPLAATEPEPAPTRSALAVLTAPDTAFVIEYTSSEPSRAAQATCTEEAPDDPALRAECLRKARERFRADVLRFRAQSAGRASLVVYRRSGANLSEVAVRNVRLFEAGPEGVRIELSGQGSGEFPFFKGKKAFEVRLPTDYTLELTDPQHGALIYSAKIGLIDR